MYFISPPSPNIFLMGGLSGHKFRGFGEKDGKLCIYRKSIYDRGDWKEYYLTDINVVKSECCDTGIHVATGVCEKLWFAVREDKFTRIFSLDTTTLKFTRYEMLQEEDNSLLHNLNLCCKCLSPIIRFIRFDSDGFSLHIDPQKYQNDVRIVRIFVDINQSGECTMWKNSFTLNQRPISSNILINENGEVLSVNKTAKPASENGEITMLSVESADGQSDVSIIDIGGNIDWLWHELAFSSAYELCFTRRNKGDKILLQILYATYSVSDSLTFDFVDYCTVDANFPSLESVHFYVTLRHVDEEFISKRGNKIWFGETEDNGVLSYIYFQLADGSTVTIPLEVLSLSQLAYIALSRVPQPSQQQQERPLPVAKILLMDYFFQRIRNLCGESKKEEDVLRKEFFHKELDDDEMWMSQEFIKKKTGWPRILPLIKAPKLPKKSE